MPGTSPPSLPPEAAQDQTEPELQLRPGRFRQWRQRERHPGPISRQVRWLTPGLGVKRWFTLFALCSLLGAFAFLHLTWTGPLHYSATRWILYLNALTDPQVVPLWVVGAVMTLLALIGAVTSMVMLSRSILQAIGSDPNTALDQIHSVRTLSRGPRVVAVGGGTGLSKLLSGMKAHSGNLTAIVTVADDGGSSGRLRESLDMIAPGDLTDCYAALSDSPVLSRLLLHRFGRGEGLSGHTFGNLLLATLSEEQGGLADAMQDVHEILKVRGQVFPATTRPATLVAELSDGRTIRGESQLATHKGDAQIVRVHLDPPELPALDALLSAIRQADLIVLGPGSLYTSILPALLVPDIAAAVRASPAPLVYVAPIMTEPGETDGMALKDHDAALSKHLGRAPDVLLLNSTPVSLEVRDRYALEHAQILGSRNMTSQVRRRVVYAPLLERGPVAHHDPQAIARALLSLKKQWGVGTARPSKLKI
ncbi:uridine diphosphate-N-acetylglucosamine-binding protein YvcK [Deinococcus sp. KNUC1210]|uniref:gluconeogenesis factor YvcK family protein n=1 Tax=Deinococcus sp. KNUC1210 TaxID=2917691 RepID=UPI001EEF9706|nr:uridine diphosphate-N-acetylglucosamine-binding protein YvcK [Deinococcus sp. KNUC1210]ULH15683.1 uridine diphosphate-N-acetylglucosamine-binding protein YvcK [Deinococcus sp. KNUC1210]